jgi:hypothetical protein
MNPGLARRLREAAQALDADGATLANLLQAHGPAAGGSLLMLLAIPCLLPIPGAGTVLGCGVLALAVAMWRGHPEAVLPPRVADLRLSRESARRVLTMLACVHGLAERIATSRLAHLVPAWTSAWLALTVAAMAVLVILPIPFGNVLPALALTLLGIGLVFRDGVAVLLGAVTAVGTTALMVTLALLAADWATQVAGFS